MRRLLTVLAGLWVFSSAADATTFCYEPGAHGFGQTAVPSCVHGDTDVTRAQFQRSVPVANQSVTVLTTRDGTVQISLPPTWVQRYERAKERPDSSILAADARSHAYLLVLFANKSDGYGLKIWSDQMRESLTNNYGKVNVSDTSKIVVNGRPALRFLLTGYVNGGSARFVVTTVEFETRIVSVAVWASPRVFTQRWDEFYALAAAVSESGAVAQKPQPPAPGEKPRTVLVTGTGFVLSEQGQILTNNHVVNDCVDQVYGALPGKPELKLRLVARDPRNDLALLMAPSRFSKAVALRGASIRPGDAVIAIGYPLFGTLSSEPIVTTGIVSALGGLQDDSRFLQISASVQPGNSGGPLLDMAGKVVGVVTQKINQLVVARETGVLPENVNFALKTGVIRDFLDKSAVSYQIANAGAAELAVADVAARARDYTLLIWCKAVLPE
jgi:S1-C subfamily serine protease